MMAAYRWVSPQRMDTIVNRLQKKTVAYTASNADFDNQNCHVAYIQQRDPSALRKGSKKGSAESQDKITERVSRPTTASTASRHNFDAQECHIDYLRKTLNNYPPETRSLSSLDDVTSLGEKLSKETTASRAARHDFDAQREHVKYLERIDPKYPGNKKYGLRRKTAPFISITAEPELEELGQKWSKGTTASTAARHDFDAQREHVKYLEKNDPQYPGNKKYGYRRKTAPFMSITSTTELTELGEKWSKETAASRAARHDFDAQKEHVKYIEQIDPKYPGNKKYGFRCKSAPFKAISSESELENLNRRLTKPTVASEGGKALRDKEYIYVPPVYSSAFPQVKDGDIKFKGAFKLTTERMEESVERLSRLPKRYR